MKFAVYQNNYVSADNKILARHCLECLTTNEHPEEYIRQTHYSHKLTWISSTPINEVLSCAGDDATAITCDRQSK